MKYISKNAKLLEFNTNILQLLDESWILIQFSSTTDATITFIGKQSDKQKFRPTISSNKGLFI